MSESHEISVSVSVTLIHIILETGLSFRYLIS